MIRRATQDDIDTILDITNTCAQHMVDQGIFQWNDQYPNKSAFEKDIAREELYVLEIDRKIRACVVISDFMDIEYKSVSWLTPSTNNLYIHRLAVHPQYQGQGYAQQLMDYAEKNAQKKQYLSIRLDTFSKNLRNQRFYEQRGYQRLGNIYFPKQSDAPFYCYEFIF